MATLLYCTEASLHYKKYWCKIQKGSPIKFKYSYIIMTMTLPECVYIVHTEAITYKSVVKPVYHIISFYVQTCDSLRVGENRWLYPLVLEYQYQYVSLGV